MEINKIIIIILLVLFVLFCINSIEFYNPVMEYIDTYIYIPDNSTLSFLDIEESDMSNPKFTINYSSYDGSILILNITGTCINAEEVNKAVFNFDINGTSVSINPTITSIVDTPTTTTTSTATPSTSTVYQISVTSESLEFNNLKIEDLFTVTGNLSLDDNEYEFNPITFSTPPPIKYIPDDSLLSFTDLDLRKHNFTITYDSYDETTLILNLDGSCQYYHNISEEPIFNFKINDISVDQNLKLDQVTDLTNYYNLKLDESPTKLTFENLTISDPFTVTGNLILDKQIYKFNPITFSTTNNIKPTFLSTPLSTPLPTTPDKIKLIFKLNLPFPSDVKKTISNINDELVKILLISPERIQRTDISPGSIYVNLYIYPETNKDLTKYVNNNIPSILIIDNLRNKLVNTNFPMSSILKEMDKNYGIQIIQDIEVYRSFAELVPENLTIIDKLIKSGETFALYTKVQNLAIPNSNGNNVISEKMYLSYDIKNGMMMFSDKLGKNSAFNLSKVMRKFKKKEEPYKYIDFNRTIVEDKIEYIESTFYNLSLKYNNLSVTYCQQDCDNSNVNGLCAQEVYQTNKPSSFPGKDKTDRFNLKNLIKFKIEEDNKITPYFISMNPEERIYYLTNKYSTLESPSDYKTIVQVPVYTNNEQYYSTPVYNKNNQNTKGYYTYENTNMVNLSPVYTNDEIKDFQERQSMSISDTMIDENSAYKLYAYDFDIEIISAEVYDKLQSY